jgi:hypothetical protein
MVLGHGLDRVRERSDEFIDLRLLDDERRRQRDDVAGYADKNAAVEAVDEDFERARRRCTGSRFELDATNKTEVANVDDMWETASEWSVSPSTARDRSALNNPRSRTARVS